MKTSRLSIALPVILLAASCDKWQAETETNAQVEFSLSEVAQIIASLPIEAEQLMEVSDAVRSSSYNGYDEEYTMRDILRNPGTGVGEKPSKTKAESYGTPIRSLLDAYFSNKYSTKAGGTDRSAVETSLAALESSDIQVYFPYHSSVDASRLPVVTFDPGTSAQTNIGYCMNPDGSVEELVVNEAMARERPVWVINNNDDRDYTSLEMKRRENPEWGQGGTIMVKSSPSNVRSLVLKDICMKRNFDPWFAGASELMVKCGSADGFSASTEAELKLFQPSVTDFMIVVKRGQVGESIPFNGILISDFTDQIESFAFLMTEDDGGTRTSWKCTSNVKIQSKSYGFDIDLPFNSKDDIVWRGSISAAFFEKYSGKTQHFGDVDLTFELK